jgi:hypothetical protein
MAGSLTIGRSGHYLERLRQRTTQVLRVAGVCLALVACSGSGARKTPADLAPYVPVSAKVVAAADRKTPTGRTASVTLSIPGSVDEFVSAFKTAARQQGYEEQLDRVDGNGTAAGRVIAYKAAGDRTLTLQLTTEPAGHTAALVLATP